VFPGIGDAGLCLVPPAEPMHTHTHTHTHVYMYVCMYIYIHAYMYVYVCVGGGGGWGGYLGAQTSGSPTLLSEHSPLEEGRYGPG
jgi:hypothetical protein